MIHAAQSGRPTLSQALGDFGWLWLLFASVVGAPSILALLQMIFVEHRLVAALQWIVEGYNDIASVLGAIVEPRLRPIIAWLNRTFEWRLDLLPHWRPLALLALIRVSAAGRALGMGFHWFDAFVSLPIVALATMAGVVVSGSIPLDAGWGGQGAMAAAPIAFMTGAIAFMGAASEGIKIGGVSGRFIGALLDAAFFSLVAFGVGAALKFVPGLPAGAGVVGLGLFLLLQSAMFVSIGLRDSPYTVRMGLMMLGGFATSAIILLADIVIRALNA